MMRNKPEELRSHVIYILWSVQSVVLCLVVSCVKVELSHKRKTFQTQCVDKPTRYNSSYEWSLLSINWLYIFLTISSLSSRASSHKLYNALVCSCYQESLAVAWMYIQESLAVAWMYIHATARLSCTNIPMRRRTGIYQMRWTAYNVSPDDGLI